ncbi:unnamed protein product [Durusdinium trenchii]|uniref:Uncharacterized protein n=1 Tax=Durusdinium trenchii TaxID=1381693 RepID=A0ABP0KZH5_9DINO
MNQDSQTCSCSLHVTIATLLLPAAPIAALGSWRSDWALWGGFPKKIGNVQELPAWCARSILTIIKDAATIASNAENDLKRCQDEDLVGMKCAAPATKAVRAASDAGKYMAEFEVRGCDQQRVRGYFGVLYTNGGGSMGI